MRTMTCKACELIENKETLKVYEDDTIVAVLASKGWVKGQVDVFTKKHETEITKLDDEGMTHFLQTSAHVASAVFEALGPQGTNVIINEGNILGEENNDNHLCAHIVPRKFEDNLNLMWKPKTMDDEEKDKVLEKLKDKAFALDQKKGKKEEKGENREGKEVAQQDEYGHEKKEGKDSHEAHEQKGEKVDYRLKQLIRIP